MGHEHAGHVIAVGAMGGRLLDGPGQRLARSGARGNSHLAAQPIHQAFEMVEPTQQLFVAAALLPALGTLGREDALDAGASARRARVDFVASDLDEARSAGAVSDAACGFDMPSDCGT